jgi:4-hydroxybenzoate polyprenyltransferase/phosphoserine phosphatase
MPEVIIDAAWESDAGAKPLCVDLDGTLVRTDMLYESLLKLLSINPFYAVILPFWLLRGRAYLKRQIAQRVRLDVGVLPYRAELLKYLQQQAAGGRRLVLVTASDALIAAEIASHLGVFGDVVASDGTTNLKGRHKATALEARFGSGRFTYVGNEWADLPVWSAAGTAVVVSDDRCLADGAARVAAVERVFAAERGGLGTLLRALRIYQWVKNLLVFVPLVAAHRISDLEAIQHSLLAFIAFGLVASAGYLLNDLVDVEADRYHHAKKQRPFASGALDFRVGLVGAPALFAIAGAVCLALPTGFGLTLIVYLLASQVYSFFLKKLVLADVFTLAVLYTMRIIAGTAAIQVPISHWLLAFSVFLFLCLAFVKRYSELHTLRAQQRSEAKGRGYFVSDFELLASLGAASGYIAVLVLALYINSPEVKVLYNRPEVLWMVCLVLLYWISRIWLISHRGQMHDDPIVFALRDRASYLAGVVCAGAVILATL